MRNKLPAALLIASVLLVAGGKVLADPNGNRPIPPGYSPPLNSPNDPVAVPDSGASAVLLAIGSASIAALAFARIRTKAAR